jgi:AMP nucleosidase
MKTKEEIVNNWLPRYTGTPLEEFGKYILLVNFSNYVNMFAEMNGTRVCCPDKPMPNATAEGITIIDFGMGSANAATIMDLLSAIKPKAVLFLGKCGGLKKSNHLGDLILPIAAIRGEGTSNDYFPPCRRSRHLTFKKPFQPPSATTITITGQAQSILPTGASGSTTIFLKNTWCVSARWL